MPSTLRLLHNNCFLVEVPCHMKVTFSIGLSLRENISNHVTNLSSLLWKSLPPLLYVLHLLMAFEAYTNQPIDSLPSINIMQIDATKLTIYEAMDFNSLTIRVPKVIGLYSFTYVSLLSYKLRRWSCWCAKESLNHHSETLTHLP